MQSNKRRRGVVQFILKSPKRLLWSLAVVVGVAVSGTGLAEWLGVLPTSPQKQIRVEPMAFNADAPSKEYVYAGGRMIATEEPTGSGSTQPPFLTSLSPTSAQRGTIFMLTINGTNLQNASAITFTGDQSNVFSVSNISANAQGTQVTATVSISSTANPGAFSVRVTAGGLNSTNYLVFTIVSAGNPLPNLASITPPTVNAGGPAFTLTVNGSGFITGTYNSVVRLNGSDHATTYINANQVTAAVTASDIANPGSISVTVFNPAPGGGESNALLLTVSSSGSTNPVPSITSISPSSVAQNSGSFTLTVTGVNFIASSVVMINGSSRTTTSVSATQLTATILSLDTITTGSKAINVFNPTPGGGTSNSVYLQVTGGSSTNGLRGDYFANQTLSGSPAVTRTDPNVNFDWGTGSPAPPTIPDEHFSVRWSGQVRTPSSIYSSEYFTFYITSDDGCRLWVNDQPIINGWQDQDGSYEWSGSLFLQTNTLYNIRVEYYENTVGARISLSWKSRTVPKAIIPQSNLVPPTGTPPPAYQGTFEIANCSTISGWAVDANQSSSSINVDIYNNGGLLQQNVPANGYRGDIPYPGNHGFSINTPTALQDGQAHTVAVYFSGTTIPLTSSPRTITCSGTTAPDPPYNLAATLVTTSQIDLTWQHTGLNVNGFIVARKEDSGSYADIQTINSASARSYSDTQGLRAGHTYYYKVRAFNSLTSPDSNEVSVTISGGSTGTPNAPSGLVATYMPPGEYNRHVLLTWSDNSDNEANFFIYRRDPYSKNRYLFYATVPANTAFYRDYNIRNSTQYSYYITAQNGSGESLPSNTYTLTTPSASITCLAVSALSGTGGSSGNYGYEEGDSNTAKWRNPSAAVAGIDPLSHLPALFVADTDNHRIRMIYLEGPAQGHSKLLAGSGIAGYADGGGDPYEVRYNYPQGIAAVKNQNGVVEYLLIADTDNHCIRMLLPPAGGDRWRDAAFAAKGGKSGFQDSGSNPGDTLFNEPTGITAGIDNLIYVADTGNQAVRRLDGTGWTVTLYRTTGSFQPVGIAMSEYTGGIYVSDMNSHVIYSVTSGTLTLIAGSVGNAGYADGTGTAARFSKPTHLVSQGNQSGGKLYIADLFNNRIRSLDLSNNAVGSEAGNGAADYVNGACGSAAFNSPSGLGLSPSGLYVSEKSNNSVRKVQ